jgi:Xaa-Pro aminopeptidase
MYTFVDPLHLNYLANFHVDPVSLNAGFGAILTLHPDHSTILYHDNRLKTAAAAAHVDQRISVEWYNGQTPGQGIRGELFTKVVAEAGGRLFDAANDYTGGLLARTLGRLRRQKDPDELDVLRKCMAATAAGHAWALAHIRPGLTELDVYAGVAHACTLAAGRPVIVYGDFAVSPGPERRGGGPTDRVLQSGDLFILDFSVVINGYRSDYTNTLSVGKTPTAEQQALFARCQRALVAGAAELRAGVRCQAVYDAVRAELARDGSADSFTHHAGHGIGLTHPEAPFFVARSAEVLQAGDVVTLEPGLYVADVGGVRLEHNYHITATGAEQLSTHELRLG